MRVIKEHVLANEAHIVLFYFIARLTITRSSMHTRHPMKIVSDQAQTPFPTHAFKLTPSVYNLAVSSNAAATASIGLFGSGVGPLLWDRGTGETREYLCELELPVCPAGSYCPTAVDSALLCPAGSYSLGNAATCSYVSASFQTLYCA